MQALDEGLNVCGPNVRRIRLSRVPVVTQEQLAISLQILGWDIDRFGVSKIERGRRQITDRELLLLATALNVPIGALFGQAVD